MFEETNRRTSYGAGRSMAVAWGGVAAVGVLLVVLGVLALGYTFTTGVISIVFLGAIIGGGGIAEMFGAFRSREGGRAVPFLAGLLSLIVGALLIFRPGAGLVTVALLLGAYYVASGLFRGITSVIDRYDQWGWDFAYGVAATLLGGYVLATWPVSSLWLVGTLVAVEIILRGFAWIAGGFAMRRVTHAAHDVIDRGRRGGGTLHASRG